MTKQCVDPQGCSTPVKCEDSERCCYTDAAPVNITFKNGDLAERRSTHGDYVNCCNTTQAIMRILENGEAWGNMTDVHYETVHMIVHKLTRMVEGNPFQHDHAADIAGYATRLVEYLETIDDK